MHFFCLIGKAICPFLFWDVIVIIKIQINQKF